MLTIELYDLKFYCFHGFHEEERILGNEYKVSVSVLIGHPGKIESIHETVNYVSVYHVIRKRMEVPALLLETLAQEMADEIQVLDKQIKSIDIRIRKMHPPIKGMEGSVGVNYKREF